MEINASKQYTPKQMMIIIIIIIIKVKVKIITRHDTISLEWA